MSELENDYMELVEQARERLGPSNVQQPRLVPYDLLAGLADAVEQLQDNNDSLRFELRGMDHVRQSDNAYLIGERDELRARVAALETKIDKL